ncbi:Crp/Fnr family transcriptional regulator [soil metagenome]
MNNFLQAFDIDLTERILRSGTRRWFASNQYVFFEGDIATFLPIVLSGRIKMVRFPEAGKEIILGLFRAGDVFAIPPAMDGRQFPATAVALEKSEVLLLPREDFLALMGMSSDFSSAIMGRMCGILREKADMVQILATPSAEQRIANVLLRLVGEIEVDEVKKIPHRRQDIAEMAGLTLETTIRVIRKMAEKGCFNIVGGRIMLETTEPLRKLVR